MTWHEMRWDDITLHTHTHTHIYTLPTYPVWLVWYFFIGNEPVVTCFNSFKSSPQNRLFLDIRLWINHPSYGGLCRCQSHGHLRWLLHFLGWAFPFFMAQCLHPPVSMFFFLNFDLYFQDVELLGFGEFISAFWPNFHGDAFFWAVSPNSWGQPCVWGSTP